MPFFKTASFNFVAISSVNGNMPYLRILRIFSRCFGVSSGDWRSFRTRVDFIWVGVVWEGEGDGVGIVW